MGDFQKKSELDEFISYNDDPPATSEEIRTIINCDQKELSSNFCRGCGYCVSCFKGIEINQCVRMS